MKKGRGTIYVPRLFFKLIRKSLAEFRVRRRERIEEECVTRKGYAASVKRQSR